MSRLKVKKVCKECGSEEVVKDAWSGWDSTNQQWVLDNVFDHEFCQTCESETTIVDQPITD